MEQKDGGYHNFLENSLPKQSQQTPNLNTNYAKNDLVLKASHLQVHFVDEAGRALLPDG